MTASSNAQDQAPPASRPGRERPSGWTLLEKLLGLIVAICGVVVAVLGVGAAQANNAADSAKNEVQDQNEVVQSLQGKAQNDQAAIVSLQSFSQSQEAQIQAQTDEISRLKSQPESTATETTSDTASSPVATAIRHKGKLTLASGGDYADLNSPASNPLWGPLDTNYVDSMNY